MSNELSDVFDINPLPVVKLPAVDYPPSNIQDDATEARNNLKNLMATATSALENALNVAIQSESPRAYEVVANLIQTSADLSSRVMDTHMVETRVSNIKVTDVTATQNNTTNNVIFSGTPAELAAMLKKL
jgi:hypothetical protein